MQTIPAEQLQAFLQEAKVTGVYEMCYIELATGLRRGELLGLKWQDINWKNGIIKVRRQIARVERSRPDYGKCAEYVIFGFVADRKAWDEQCIVPGFAVRF